MSARQLITYVDGVDLWAPRLPGWDAARAILRGEAEAPAQPAARPVARILAPNERRRAPDSVAVALHVAERACDAARAAPCDLPSVFASTYGDCAVNDAVCAQLAQAPAQTSPTKFHHSVHNAAAGYWAIAAGCLAPYTALTADRHTFGTGLLGAVVEAGTRDSRVLCVAYDTEATGPLATMTASRGLFGAALVLAPRAGATTIARLVLQLEPREAVATPARPTNAALVAGNAMASSLALFEALADACPRGLTLTLAPQLALEVSITPSALCGHPRS